MKDVLLWKFNGQMWFSTVNRPNECISSCRQVSVLENINTFVHFLKLFVCHSINYYLSSWQVKYMMKFFTVY